MLYLASEIAARSGQGPVYGCHRTASLEEHRIQKEKKKALKEMQEPRGKAQEGHRTAPGTGAGINPCPTLPPGEHARTPLCCVSMCSGIAAMPLPCCQTLSGLSDGGAGIGCQGERERRARQSRIRSRLGRASGSAQLRGETQSASHDSPGERSGKRRIPGGSSADWETLGAD